MVGLPSTELVAFALAAKPEVQAKKDPSIKVAGDFIHEADSEWRESRIGESQERKSSQKSFINNMLIDFWRKFPESLPTL
ncbi:hypothetical protein [Microbulbifer pacificus]|uniref:hypothetical protein n=1 Tax=Microbulbifer pacificus TaxID=407164 RepID=UPI000CF47089|nr:hypothetical protein [Microbulbifer pacificus]